MPSDNDQLLCYNKGCGKSFHPNENKEDSCSFHPGVPVFHDAYKGWSCCKKKCIDFTEFLNIKGCTTSFHTNVKPEEPQKPAVDKSNSEDVIEYRAPKPASIADVERPPFDSPMTIMRPVISDSLRQQVAASIHESADSQEIDPASGDIPVGTTCKNSGCRQAYEGPQTLQTSCTFHPGCPIFHEGLKFWSCCQKRTTDFNVFLEQVGCNAGEHVWFKSKSGNAVKCRLDWHQTGSAVIVSVFAKKYDPNVSSVQLSPVRLKIHLVFPKEGGVYQHDVELRGVIKVEESSVQMLPTKVEITMRKSNGASWSHLEIPRLVSKPPELEESQPPKVTSIEEQVDAVDLSDL